MSADLSPLDAAKAALAKSDFAKAIRLLKPLVEAEPDGNATFFMARAEFGAGALERAEDHISQFRLRKPKHAGALLVQAQIQQAQGKDTLALASAKAALEAQPDLVTARRLVDQIEQAESLGSARTALALIDAGYLSARANGPTPEMLKAAADLAALPPVEGWARNPETAKIAYFQNASDLTAALRNYDAHLIEVSCEFDYISWPKRIQDHVRGKSVIDVGCGFGGFGMGFLVAGATSYFGLDPVMQLDSTRAKNKRTRTWSDMGITPREIAKALPAIRLHEGTSEDLELVEKFDTVSLHNVTEHLIQLDLVFNGLGVLCGPDTHIVFLHHNFYCWNGHHFSPVQPAQLDENDPAHQVVYDWRHINFAANLPEDHYFKTHLNRVRLDEIRAITEKYFEIAEWREIPSNAATLARLTPEVLARVRRTIPDIQERELTTNVVFCVARLRPDAATKPAKKTRKPAKPKA